MNDKISIINFTIINHNVFKHSKMKKIIKHLTQLIEHTYFENEMIKSNLNNNKTKLMKIMNDEHDKFINHKK